MKAKLLKIIRKDAAQVFIEDEKYVFQDWVGWKFRHTTFNELKLFLIKYYYPLTYKLRR